MPVYPNQSDHVRHTPSDASFWLPLSVDEKAAVGGAIRRLLKHAETQNDIGLAQDCRRVLARCDNLMPGLASIRVAAHVGPVAIERGDSVHFSSLGGEAVVNVDMAAIPSAALLPSAALHTIEARANALLPIAARVSFPNPIFHGSEHYSKTEEGLRSPIVNQEPSAMQKQRAAECYRNSALLASRHSLASTVFNVVAL